jgi:hypothetical protein
MINAIFSIFIDSSRTFHKRGKEYMSQQKYDESIPEFSKAIELNPKIV